MKFIDYYKVLEIDSKATQSDIKKAYRKLARKLHPDLNPDDAGAQRKFQRINEANAVLSDPEKRKKYDTYGKDWEHADAFEEAKRSKRTSQGGGRRYTAGGSASNQDFSDFFKSMFGGGGFSSGGRTSAQFKGQDLNATLSLKLSQVLEDQKQTLDVGNKKIRITIPAGVEDGQTIKITGYGGDGVNGGPKGDLYLTFQVLNDTPFKRVGSDLYSTKTVDLYTALLGSEIEIKTLTGKVKLKLKPETQNDTKVKLKGKGLPVYKKKNSFGNLYVTYKIKMPTHLTAEEKKLFKQLSQLRN